MCYKWFSLTLFLGSSVTSVLAHEGMDSVLVQDTVWVGNAAATPGSHIMIPVTGKNTIHYAAMVVPLEYRLPNGNSPVICDSVSFNGCRTNYFAFKYANLSRDTLYHELLIALITNLGGGELPLAPGIGPWAKMYFTVKSNAMPCTVSIDSTFFPPSNVLTVVDTFTTEYTPQYVPGKIIILSAVIQEGKKESKVEGIRLNISSPVREGLTLNYALSKAGAVHLELYDALGEKIQTIFEGVQGVGWHKVRVGLKPFAGVYFVRLQEEKESVTRKVVIMR